MEDSDGSDEDDDEDDFESSLPNDTLAAIYSLASQFPSICYHDRIPFVALKHHLYAIVKDATMVYIYF